MKNDHIQMNAKEFLGNIEQLSCHVEYIVQCLQLYKATSTNYVTIPNEIICTIFHNTKQINHEMY